MTETDPKNKAEQPDSNTDVSTDDTSTGQGTRPKELGGRNGPDPTRYGDWEKAGRCIDF